MKRSKVGSDVYKGMTGGLFEDRPLEFVPPPVGPKIEAEILAMLRSRSLAGGEATFVWAVRSCWLTLGGKGEPTEYFAQKCRAATEKVASCWPTGGKHSADHSADRSKAVKVGVSAIESLKGYVARVSAQAPV